MPWTLGTTLLPHLGADARGNEPCPLCAPGYECAHFDGQCVRLAIPSIRGALHSCDGWSGTRVWVVTGPGGPSAWVPCRDCGTPMGWFTHGELTFHHTEAEARAEFERRVAALLGREVE